ncbi:MAG TPA: glycosyltransferase family 4 protein [Anaerolineae bacterium]|nr:glycosyltransferase family 4 protein [Anaerolineae bacterium]
MRIALLSHYPDDETAPAGGVWAVGRNLAAGLVAAGAEVHVVRYVAAPASDKPCIVVAGQPPLVVHTVLLPRRRTQPLRRAAAVPALIEAVQAIRPDAISAHESEYGLAAVRSGLPAAVTIHGIPRQEFLAFQRWRDRLDLALTVGQDWLMVREARHIVAINNYALRQYQERTRACFYRINVPIGEVFFQVAERMPDPHTLLMVGGMNERKDPLLMLQALAFVRQAVPDVVLRIAGRPLAGPFGARVQHTIDDLGLAGHVQFLGSLDQPQLAQAYATAAVTVLSSRQETSPAVLMEAMAARRPVVATDVGGVAEIVDDGVSGYVTPPGDAAALAERVQRVLLDPTAAASMGAAGRLLAEANYSRELVGRQYLAMLRHIVEVETRLHLV